MIKPSVGRRLYYWPHPEEKSFEHDQPFDAGIAHVHDDTTITVTVNNDLGYPIAPKQHITLAQDRQALPGECGWMPYQEGQARAAAQAAATP